MAQITLVSIKKAIAAYSKLDGQSNPAMLMSLGTIAECPEQATFAQAKFIWEWVAKYDRNPSAMNEFHTSIAAIINR